VGELIDIAAWRQRADATTRTRVLGVLAPSGAAAAWRAWASAREARWLQTLLSEAVDHYPGRGGDDFSLAGLPIPPRVTAWLRRGAALLGLTEAEIVTRTLGELARPDSDSPDAAAHHA
jgi:hypothetical protein